MKKKIQFNIYQLITTILLISILAGFVSCESPQQEAVSKKSQKKEKKLKEGLYKTKHQNGNVHTAVNYKAGRKNGLSTSYYENGNKQLEMPYENGIRSGVSNKYYESGDIYAKTPFVDNEINGIRKTYYSNGQIKAETPYKNSLMGIGTKLYSTNGQPIPEYQLIVEKLNNESYSISTDKACRKITFFEGALIEEKYLDESQVIALPMSKGKGIFKNKYNESSLNFICKCTTEGSTTFLLNKSLTVK